MHVLLLYCLPVLFPQVATPEKESMIAFRLFCKSKNSSFINIDFSTYNKWFIIRNYSIVIIMINKQIWCITSNKEKSTVCRFIIM